MPIYRGYTIKWRSHYWQVWRDGELVYSTPYEQAALHWIDEQHKQVKAS